MCSYCHWSASAVSVDMVKKPLVGGDRGTIRTAVTHHLTKRPVLTDHIAVPDGRTMTSLVKSLAPATPVVVMTGFPTPEDERASFAAGAAGYLVKPFKLSELRAAIGNCLKPGT